MNVLICNRLCLAGRVDISMAVAISALSHCPVPVPVRVRVRVRVRGLSSIRIGKREAIKSIAGFRLRFAAAPRGDDYELTAVDLVGGGGGIAPGVHLEFPEQFSRELVEGVKTFVHGRADEDQSAG